jgi:hypothetical protein
MELPGIDSLVYSDGTLTILNTYSVLSDDDTQKYYAFPMADTTIESVEHYNDDVWTEIQPHPDSIVTDECKISFGEGSMGNEGFVAVENKEGLVWALFSTISNPFISLKIVDGYLWAASDFLLYKININNPKAISIEHRGDLLC